MDTRIRPPLSEDQGGVGVGDVVMNVVGCIKAVWGKDEQVAPTDLTRRLRKIFSLCRLNYTYLELLLGTVHPVRLGRRLICCALVIGLPVTINIRHVKCARRR